MKKLLLTLSLSLVVSGSVYASCSADTPLECKTQVLCEGVNLAKPAVAVVKWNNDQCVKLDTAQGTPCIGVVDSTASKTVVPAGKDASAPAAAGKEK